MKDQIRNLFFSTDVVGWNSRLDCVLFCFFFLDNIEGKHTCGFFPHVQPSPWATSLLAVETTCQRCLNSPNCAADSCCPLVGGLFAASLNRSSRWTQSWPFWTWYSNHLMKEIWQKCSSEHHLKSSAFFIVDYQQGAIQRLWKPSAHFNLWPRLDSDLTLAKPWIFLINLVPGSDVLPSQ